MTKRSTLKNHIVSLEEIRNIVSAMKNLSLMEISKATKFFSAQERVVSTIKKVATDFFNFHPHLAAPLFTAQPLIYILIGSERGFCGNFNQMIIEQWESDIKKRGANVKEHGATKPKTLLVGNKLATKVPATLLEAEKINGPNATEEIQAVILTIIKKLEKIAQEASVTINPANWVIIFNEETVAGIRPKVIQPFVTLSKEKAPQLAVAPLLYLEPQQFLLELVEQYLFAVLYRLFYESFIIEHQERLKHMESALDWIEKKNIQLKLHMNELRQEEITEEIEVIMLSVKTLVDY